MAITATLKTSGSSASNATSYATASITPTASRLLLLSVANNVFSGTATTPTATGGGGLTWVQVTTVASGTYRTTLFRAMKPSGLTSGTVTIDFAGATQQRCAWSITEFASMITAGTDGAGAIIQSGVTSAATGTTGLVTLGAFTATENATFGAFGRALEEVSAPGSGFTELSDSQVSAEALSLETEWRNDNDTTVDATWSTSSRWMGIGVEIGHKALALDADIQIALQFPAALEIFDPDPQIESDIQIALELTGTMRVVDRLIRQRSVVESVEHSIDKSGAWRTVLGVIDVVES